MANIKHMKSNTTEYQAFHDAKARCTNKRHRLYEYYGGRGIKFLFESFEHFIDAIGYKPEKTLSLDRINNDGHYEPCNVRWATKSDQLRNRRKFHKPNLVGNEFNAKQYIVIFPDGTRKAITNMAKFCREHGLDKANLNATLPHGKAKTHKGFRAEYWSN